MENQFDFGDVTKVTRKATRNTGDAPLTRKAKDKEGNIPFRLSPMTFSQLGLETNSLEVVQTKDKKNVFLKVCPGNSGDFMKSRGSKVKGRQATHNELSAAIDEAGMSGNGFDLQRFKETDYYQIVPAQVVKEAPKAKKEKKAKEVEA